MSSPPPGPTRLPPPSSSSSQAPRTRSPPPQPVLPLRTYATDSSSGLLLPINVVPNEDILYARREHPRLASLPDDQLRQALLVQTTFRSSASLQSIGINTTQPPTATHVRRFREVYPGTSAWMSDDGVRAAILLRQEHEYRDVYRMRMRMGYAGGVVPSRLPSVTPLSNHVGPNTRVAGRAASLPNAMFTNPPPAILAMPSPTAPTSAPPRGANNDNMFDGGSTSASRRPSRIIFQDQFSAPPTILAAPFPTAPTSPPAQRGANTDSTLNGSPSTSRRPSCITFQEPPASPTRAAISSTMNTPNPTGTAQSATILVNGDTPTETEVESFRAHCLSLAEMPVNEIRSIVGYLRGRRARRAAAARDAAATIATVSAFSGLVVPEALIRERIRDLEITTAHGSLLTGTARLNDGTRFLELERLLSVAGQEQEIVAAAAAARDRVTRSEQGQEGEEGDGSEHGEERTEAGQEGEYENMFEEVVGDFA